MNRIETAMAAVKAAVTNYHDIAAVGSAFYRYSGFGSGVDIIVLVDSLNITFDGPLSWERGGSILETDTWRSFKAMVEDDAEGVEVNMLLVADKMLFQLWKRCARACRAIYMRTGSCDRVTAVAIHQAIMDEWTADEIVGPW